MRTFGRRLRRAREAEGWTQDELGRALIDPVSASEIQGFEAGRLRPLGYVVYQLSVALGITLDELFGSPESGANDGVRERIER